MKKVTLFLAAFLIAGAVKAQDSVTLDMQLLPSKKYDQVSAQNMQIEMAYGGESKKMDMSISMKGNILTDKAEKGMIPVKMNMSMSMGMKMEGMPDNITDNKIDIYGKVKQGEFVPVFDSIVAQDMPSTAKQAAMDMVKEMLTKVSYPKKTLKIGETFVQDVPMDIPLGGGAMKMNNVVTYKLIRVEGKKAYFDVIHDISMDGDLEEGMNMKGSGKGKGEMVYDIDTKYPVVYNADMDMVMQMEQGGMSISVKMNTKIAQATTVGKGK